MKTTVPIFLLLLLFGGILFYVAHSTASNQQTADVVNTFSRVDKPSLSERWTQKPDIRNEPKTKTRRQELEEKVNAAMAAFVASRDRKAEQKHIEVMMSAREPEYRKLFESWGMDSTSINQTLNTIRARETRLMEARHQRNKAGIAGLRVAVKDEIAGVQLEKILGDKHHEEFIQLEIKMDASDRAKVQDIVSSASRE